MYQLTEDPDVVLRLADGASIPRGHRFWDVYEAWRAAGNTPSPAPDQRGRRLRARRDAMLDRAVRVLDRHRNQVDFQLPPSLTAVEARAWAVYAQQLRDLPSLPGFPDVPLPEPPGAIDPGVGDAPSPAA